MKAKRYGRKTVPPKKVAVRPEITESDRHLVVFSVEDGIVEEGSMKPVLNQIAIPCASYEIASRHASYSTRNGLSLSNYDDNTPLIYYPAHSIRKISILTDINSAVVTPEPDTPEPETEIQT